MKKLYHYPSMFIFSILAVIVLIVFEIVFFVTQTIFDPDIYSESMSKESVSESVYNSLDEYFEQYAAPTRIPKEVFTDSLDEDKLTAAVYSLIDDCLQYLTNSDAPVPEPSYDFTELEESITSYIEEYSEENDIEKDDDYYDLIENTISTAEAQINSKLDVTMLYTLTQSGFATRIHAYTGYIKIALPILAVLLLVIIGIMFIINLHHLRDMPYWIGSILFTSSLIILVPVLYLDKTSYFDNFFISTEYIYNMITGLINTAMSRIITFQTILCIIGVVLIISTLIIQKLYKKYLKLQHQRHRSDI